MTAKTTTEVLSGAPNVAGYVFSAPLSADNPTNASAPLGAGFVNLGYISDEGITIRQGSTVVEIRDWFGEVIETLDDEVSASVSMTLMQTGATTLKEIYGDANVTAGVDGKVTSAAFTGDPLPHKKWAWELKNAKGLGRIFAEDGKITEIGEQNITKSGIISYPVTVTFYRGPSGKFFERFFSWNA